MALVNEDTMYWFTRFAWPVQICSSHVLWSQLQVCCNSVDHEEVRKWCCSRTGSKVVSQKDEDIIIKLPVVWYPDKILSLFVAFIEARATRRPALLDSAPTNRIPHQVCSDQCQRSTAPVQQDHLALQRIHNNQPLGRDAASYLLASSFR